MLIEAPEMRGKLEDIWEGPYEVIRLISDVTLEIAVPSRLTKRQVVHINRIKAWIATEAAILHVVVAQDDEDSISTLTKDHSLKESQQEQIDQLLHKYKEVVTERLGKTKTVLLQINTGQAAPICAYPYRIPSAWKDQLREEVRSLAEIGILKPSFSPWSSPMVPVRKPDGSVRLCLNFLKINAVTTPDPYLMPRVDDMLTEIGNAKFLTKMDLNKGFHQIPLREEDQCKTAFCTPWGKWQYTVMPFGLRNAPAIFQRLMHIILADISSFANAYMDDIVIFSNNWDQALNPH